MHKISCMIKRSGLHLHLKFLSLFLKTDLLFTSLNCVTNALKSYRGSVQIMLCHIEQTDSVKDYWSIWEWCADCATRVNVKFGLFILNNSSWNVCTCNKITEGSSWIRAFTWSWWRENTSFGVAKHLRSQMKKTAQMLATKSDHDGDNQSEGGDSTSLHLYSISKLRARDLIWICSCANRPTKGYLQPHCLDHY